MNFELKKITDNDWQKVREIFDDALCQKPEDRQKFVLETCGGDKMLLSEVESLLSSLDGAKSFMETPAVSKVADVIEAEAKKLAKGKCFGHYEIIEQIGAGGMGEVYLAKDKKIDRKVAVKILNEKFSREESNLERFRFEYTGAFGVPTLVGFFRRASLAGLPTKVGTPNSAQISPTRKT